MAEPANQAAIDAATLSERGSKIMRWSVPVLFVCTLLSMLAYRTSTTVVDPDLWHEMALGRETVREGAVPWEDKFAYTPTVYPSVHHEWGTGLIAFLVARAGGAAGISCLNLALIFGAAGFCWLCARKGGASLPVLGSLSILAIFMADYGFSPIRAQMFSFLFTSILCYFLQIDQEGKKWWIPCWLTLYVVWLNLHAGFLVGAGLFFCFWIEQWIQGRRHCHLLAVGLIMIPLILVNPYGRHYVAYLWSAVRMDRPLISEWGPIWQAAEPHSVIAFLIGIVLFAFSLFHVGWRRYTGVILVIITAFYAVMHIRMLGFFAIAWVCFASRHFESSSFARIVKESWTQRPLPWLIIWSGAVVALGVSNWTARPWNLLVPGNRHVGEHFFSTYYPVGPVAYMQKNDFRGNLLVPFDFGAYVIWKMDGNVMVSMDSRYEVAYPPGSLEANYALFKTGNNAASVVAATEGTTAILVPQWSPLTREMTANPDLYQAWAPAYVDNDFRLYLRRESAREGDLIDEQEKVVWGRLP